MMPPVTIRVFCALWPNRAITRPMATATTARMALAAVRPTSYRIGVPVTLKPIIATKCMLQIAVPPIAIDARMVHRTRSPFERAFRNRAARVSPSSDPSTDSR
jgi:hypothetical protein